MKKLDWHHFESVVLIIGLVIFGWLFVLNASSQTSLQWLIVSLMLFYVIWGIFSHSKKGEVSVKIMLEYTSVAALAGASLHLLLL